MPLQNGKCLTQHLDVDKTCEKIAKFSEKDAKSWKEIYNDYAEFISTVFIPGLFSRALPETAARSDLEASPEGREVIRVFKSSPIDVCNQWFENEHVKSMILHQLFYPRGILPDYYGAGSAVPLIISGAEYSQISFSGSHNLAHTLWRALVANGGICRNGEVTKIIVKDGEAKGVELADGTQVMAKKAVASSIDLKQTFLELVGEDNLDSSLAKKIKNFKLDEFSIFTVHLALDEVPIHSSASFDNSIDQTHKLLVGYETTRDLMKAWHDIRNGDLPEPGFFASCPTKFDPKQAPPGKHTGVISQPVPYRINGSEDKWEDVKEEYGQRCIDKWAEYSPNIKNSIIKTSVRTPVDIVVKLKNMAEGGIFMGRLTLDQLEWYRPLNELSEFKTPIKNLYLCGSCMHPGGGIIGAPGYIAADIIAEDHNIEKWW
jgi:phytoene dehydrogenase-like protein